MGGSLIADNWSLQNIAELFATGVDDSSAVAISVNKGADTHTYESLPQAAISFLNVAASGWIDERGKTWVEAAPKIKLFSVKDARQPYPLTAEEQALLFKELPDHLAQMALYTVNTGCREQEVCGLRWDYEVKAPELDTSVFIIPGERVKNSDERLVVLNRVAMSVVESQRCRASRQPGQNG